MSRKASIRVFQIPFTQVMYLRVNFMYLRVSGDWFHDVKHAKTAKRVVRGCWLIVFNHALTSLILIAREIE